MLRTLLCHILPAISAAKRRQPAELVQSPSAAMLEISLAGVVGMLLSLVSASGALSCHVLGIAGSLLSVLVVRCQTALCVRAAGFQIAHLIFPAAARLCECHT